MRTRGQSGIVDPGNLWMRRQIARHLQSVARVAVHAQLQGFQALQEEERVKRTQRRTEIAQPFNASLHNIGEVAESFVKADSVIALARLEHLRKCPAVPRKTTAVDNDTADGGPVSADELRRGVEHDVRSMLNRTAQIWGSESVVDHQRKIGFVGDGCHGVDVQNIQNRIADGFAVNDARTRSDSAAEIPRVIRIDKNGMDP